MKGNIMVLAEPNGSSESKLIAKGRELASSLNSSLVCLVIGREERALSLASEGPDLVILAEHEELTQYHPELYLRVMEIAIEHCPPSIILMAHGHMSMDLAPALAVRHKLPIASNCSDVWFDGNDIMVSKLLYHGKLEARLRLADREPKVVTLQRSLIEHKKKPTRELAKIERLPIEGRLPSPRIKLIGIRAEAEAEEDIAKAKVIVACGRGIGSKDNIPMMERLARLLGGSIACSRPLVDMGWLPPRLQVGLSGKTIRPRLYIACGISGSPQHLVGMQDSETIVAINKDPKAPIFSVAHIGLVGDVLELVPIICREIEGAKGRPD